MTDLALGNLLGWGIQVTAVAALGLLLPSAARLAFLRALLVFCLLLPVLQPWHPAPAPGKWAAVPTGTLRVRDGIQPPKKIVHVSPVYPPDALKAGIEGVVVLEAIIDEAGKVKDTLVLKSASPPPPPAAKGDKVLPPPPEAGRQEGRNGPIAQRPCGHSGVR
jgi:TonB family protein